ncbi:MAG: polyphosphate kinase 2 family protein [Acidimicrobiales bacterium]
MDISDFRVTSAHHVELSEIDTQAPGKLDKSDTQAATAETLATLSDRQYLLHADGHQKVLVVIQATDTGGKDGVIRNVFGALNPQGVRLASFKAPNETELAHDYLWRVHAQTPESGEIAVFNRSHYEDVLVVRVHELVPEERWRKRYEHITHFEHMLTDEGTTVVKFFLHISKDEQRKRLQARLDDPARNWKFNEGDLAERKLWDDYQDAFTDMLNKTSTERAPWYVVPADNKWYRDHVVANVMLETLDGLKMAYPTCTIDAANTKVE